MYIAEIMTYLSMHYCFNTITVKVNLVTNRAFNYLIAGSLSRSIVSTLYVLICGKQKYFHF